MINPVPAQVIGRPCVPAGDVEELGLECGRWVYRFDERALKELRKLGKQAQRDIIAYLDDKRWYDPQNAGERDGETSENPPASAEEPANPATP